MLGVATTERVKEWPDMPTFKELGYDFVTFTLLASWVRVDPRADRPETDECACRG